MLTTKQDEQLNRLAQLELELMRVKRINNQLLDKVSFLVYKNQSLREENKVLKSQNNSTST